jgi:hypothetical protein
VGDFADDFGYDLDEEGHPLEDRDETTREQEGIRSSRDEGDDDADDANGDDTDEDAEETQEAAATA